MNQPKSSKAANTQPESSAANQQSGSLLDKAQELLHDGSMPDMIGRLSPSLKEAGTKAASRYSRLSTTQKVLGGALLAGAVYLTTRKRGGKGKKHESADTLHELLHFVNDRIEGYQRAVDESQDAQLRGYYKQLVSQSQRFSNELNTYLRQEGGGREESTTLKGKLYRAWMDTKAAVTGSDEKAILGSNIYGEEWALKAYEDALEQHTLTGAMRQAVEHQYTLSQKTYKELQKLVDKQ